MASVETGGAPPQATVAAERPRLTKKLTRIVSATGIAAIKHHWQVDLSLRTLLFVFSVIAVAVMVSSKQNKTIPVSPTMTIGVSAKFTHSASFTYFVSAFSVLCLYSIVTGFSSYSAMKKHEERSIFQQLYFVILDSLALAIGASATGAGGGVSYEALKGNPHIRWMKICNMFDTFCHHLAAAGAMSLLASMVLLVLLWLSVGTMVKITGIQR